MVAVNFAWGFGVFREPIHDPVSMVACFAGLAAGLTGMSHYAAPPPPTKRKHDRKQDLERQAFVNAKVERSSSNDSQLSELRARTRNDDDNDDDDPSETEESYSVSSHSTTAITNLPTAASDLDKPLPDSTSKKPSKDGMATVRLFGRVSVTTRTAGLWAAVVNGVLTGSAFFPIRYAKEQGFGGAHYFLSMATGALVSNALGWFIFWLYLAYWQHPGDWALAWQRLPSWHLSTAGRDGILCGSILTMGMFGSMVSVTYLGQGLGNSIIQAKIIVSGLWGIFGFHEITGFGRITKWLASALLAVFSILWLSAQRRWASAAVAAADALQRASQTAAVLEAKVP
jgi:hypothetical protein